MGPVSLGGSCEGKIFLHEGKSVHWQADPQGQRELWSLRGEHSNWFTEAKAERRAQSALPSTPQLEVLITEVVRGLSFGGQTQGRGLGLAAWR